MKDFFNRKNLIFMLVVFIFTVITYGQVVTFGFVWDDINFFLQNSYTHLPFSHIFDVFIPGRFTECIYTPVTSMIKFILFKIFGQSPAPYHIFDFTFYLLTIVLVYRFFLITLEKQEVAFLSALLFAVHPIHSEVVSWMSCDGYIMSMFFLMIAFNLFLNLLFKDCNQYEKLWSILFLILFYAVAILSQIGSVVFPALILVYAFIFCRQKLLFSCKISIPLFLMSALGTYFSVLGVASDRYNPQQVLPFQDKLVVISQYVLKSILPLEMMPVYPMPYDYSFSALQVIFYIFVLVLAVVLFIKINDKVYRFFILWFAVSISPNSHLFYNSSVLLADRYLYFASVASSMFMAYFLYGLSDRLKRIDYIKNRPLISYVPVIMVLVFYIISSFFYSSAWKNSFSLWSYAYSKNSTNKMVIFNLASAYQVEGKYEQALFYYDECLHKGSKELNFYIPIAYMKRADVLKNLRRYDESLDSCKKSLSSYAVEKAVYPLYYEVCMDLIRYYLSERDYEKAWESSVVMAGMVNTTREVDAEKAAVFRQAGSVSYFYGKIDDFVLYYSEGVFLLKEQYPAILLKALKFHREGLYQDAAHCYEQFLKTSATPVPDVQRLSHVANLTLYYSGDTEKAGTFLRHGIVLRDRALFLLDKGKFSEAESLMKEILSNDPYFFEVNKMLGKFYLERGETAKSIYYLQKALQFQPADAELKAALDKLLPAGK